MNEQLRELLRLSWRDILDIGLVALIYYRLILMMKGTRAVRAVYGLALVALLYYLSDELGLYTLNWLLANFLGSVFLVIIILFQNDFRKALADMGAGLFPIDSLGKNSLEEIVAALSAMAKVRMGAIIVLERRIPLGDVESKGREIGAKVSRELLMTIFFHGSPLHDGAVLIRKDRVAAAGCILPLTGSSSLDPTLGTRHRAAMGMSEESDALVLVVSEERGDISLVMDGQMHSGMTKDRLLERIKEAMSR
ncbi:MAG: diadenylate cyclase CdaA [Desulfovibrio sp.]|uniref:diadenylate cyclase CdaA n=1 Tax=Desulfovibrio sp. 7SRBS1 TaxID=3378064 RepID=UPI003B40257E